MSLFAALGLAACGDNTKKLTAAELRDPSVCANCHPTQVADWSRSMHAYASDDPVFIAMNQRGQRETNGALGNFCVKCHAPVAVRDGTTTDGLNLATLPASQHGVTCFFCHSAESVDGTHNNPLTLATDGRMFGPFSDPGAGRAAPVARYSALLDGSQTESAAACGTCHDIVNANNVPLERTYQGVASHAVCHPAARSELRAVPHERHQHRAGLDSLDGVAHAAPSRLPRASTCRSPTFPALTRRC